MITKKIVTTEGAETIEYVCSDGVKYTTHPDPEDNRIEVRMKAMEHELEYILSQLAEHTVTVYNVLKDWKYWTSYRGPKERLSKVLDSELSTKEDTYLFAFKSRGDIIEASNAVRLFYDYLIVEHQLNHIEMSEDQYHEPLSHPSLYAAHEHISYDNVMLKDDDVLVISGNRVDIYDSDRVIRADTARVLKWEYDIEITRLQGRLRLFESMIASNEEVGMNNCDLYN